MSNQPQISKETLFLTKSNELLDLQKQKEKQKSKPPMYFLIAVLCLIIGLVAGNLLITVVCFFIGFPALLAAATAMQKNNEFGDKITSLKKELNTIESSKSDPAPKFSDQTNSPLLFEKQKDKNVIDNAEIKDMDNSELKTRIYSIDGRYEKIFTDRDLLEKINYCEHPTAIYHETKDTILEIENLLLPLKPHSASLIIETKTVRILTKMTLEVFFNLLEIEKKIEVIDRFKKESPQTNEKSKSIDDEIQEFLNQLDDKKE